MVDQGKNFLVIMVEDIEPDHMVKKVGRYLEQRAQEIDLSSGMGRNGTHLPSKRWRWGRK